MTFPGSVSGGTRNAVVCFLCTVAFLLPVHVSGGPLVRVARAVTVAAEPMPESHSTAPPTLVFDSQPSITYAWMFNCSAEGMPYAHNVVLETHPKDTRVIFASFQAGSTEGGDMHLRCSTSKDGGATWSRSTVCVASEQGRSAWGPVLKVDADTGVIYLFYAFSRARTEDFGNPGGDLMVKKSVDGGNTWDGGVVILSQDSWGGQYKYFVNQLVELPHGEWMLPFGSTAPGYPSTAGDAGLLVSKGGNHDVWEALPVRFTIPAHPYISAILEPSLAVVRDRFRDQCVLMFRSGNGFVYEARSVDSAADGCREWSEAKQTVLPNPNSRTSLAYHNGVLYLASNQQNDGIDRWPAWGGRSLLTIQRSGDGGATWAGLVDLEPLGDETHCYPSIVSAAGAASSGGERTRLVTAYSVYVTNMPRIGIKVAMVQAGEGN